MSQRKRKYVCSEDNFCFPFALKRMPSVLVLFKTWSIMYEASAMNSNWGCIVWSVSVQCSAKCKQWGAKWGCVVPSLILAVHSVRYEVPSEVAWCQASPARYVLRETQPGLLCCSQARNSHTMFTVGLEDNPNSPVWSVCLHVWSVCLSDCWCQASLLILLRVGDVLESFLSIKCCLVQHINPQK